MSIQINTVNSVDAKYSSSAKKNIQITAEQLRQLYLVDGLTLPQIGKRFGVTAAAMDYWMRKFGMSGQRHVDNLLFEPSPTLSYVLGVILGDGCVHNRKAGGYVVRLNVRDNVFSESFRSALILLGFTPGKLIHIKSKNEKWHDTWLVCAYSQELGKWYESHTLEEKLEIAMKYPDAFTRGFYEAEGSLVRHRKNLDLSISNTNDDGLLILKTIQANLPRGIKSSLYSHKYEQGIGHALSITKNIDVRRFLAWTMPCMKTVPRSEHKDEEPEEIVADDDIHANTEPILDGDVEAGVENTKAIQNGRQVG